MIQDDSIVEYLKMIFMDEIAGPSPQINHLIRNQDFPWSCSVSPQFRKNKIRSVDLPSGSVISAQKQYEQNVYDFSRNLGLPMDGAEQWVLKARKFWDEKISFFQAPSSAGESTFISKDGFPDNVQLMTINQLDGVRHLQQDPLRYLENYDRRSDDDRTTQATLRPSALTDESFVANMVGHSTTETVVKEGGEKSVKRAARNARKAQRKAEKEAARQAEKSKYQKSADELVGSPEGQATTTVTFDEASQIEQLEDNDKPQRQRKKARKHKSDHELPPQSEVQPEEYHKHKKVRLDSEAQDAKSKKSKTKNRGPQYSPYFQRSSVTEAEKDFNKTVKSIMDSERSINKPNKKDVAIDKTKILMDFPFPMIQSA